MKATRGIIFALLFSLCTAVRGETEGKGQITDSTGAGDTVVKKEQIRPEYLRVFWGVLAVRKAPRTAHGEHLELTGLHPIIGNAEGAFAMLPHRVFSLRQKERGLSLPMRYVLGRRYLVFVARRPGARDQGTGFRSGVIRIVDLDETQEEARIRRLWRMQPERGRLLPGRRPDMRDKDVDEWVKGARDKIEEKKVSVADVVHALGPPDVVRLEDDPEEEHSGEAVYLMNTKGLLKQTRSEQGVVKKSCPRLTFTFKGTTVLKVSRDTHTIEWYPTKTLRFSCGTGAVPSMKPGLSRHIR